MAHIETEGTITAPGARGAMQPITLSHPMDDGLERRVCSLALQYWRELAAPHRYPSRAQVTRESAPSMWEHFFIVDVGAEATDHVFVQAGAVLCKALGCDPTGRKVADMLPRAIVGRALYYQKAACDLMAPIDEAGKWVRPDGTEVLYRAVLMPLSENQRAANYLLGAFSFRTVAHT